MSVFQTIRLGFHRRALQRILDTPFKGTRKRLNLDRASTIGILFDGSDPDRQQAVLDYNDTLRLKYHKKVQLLGFVDSDQEDGSLPFPSFSRKQVDWAFRPKGRAVEQFLESSYDLLILLHPTAHLILDFVAAQAQAHLKVGPFSEEATIYDLMIDHPQASIPQFIKEMEQLLKKTNA